MIICTYHLSWKQLYPNFLFEIAPIAFGATRLATSDLQKNIKTMYYKRWWYINKMSTNGPVGNNEDSKISHKNEQ